MATDMGGVSVVGLWDGRALIDYAAETPMRLPCPEDLPEEHRALVNEALRTPLLAALHGDGADLPVSRALAAFTGLPVSSEPGFTQEIYPAMAARSIASVSCPDPSSADKLRCYSIGDASVLLPRCLQALAPPLEEGVPREAADAEAELKGLTRYADLERVTAQALLRRFHAPYYRRRSEELTLVDPGHLRHLCLAYREVPAKDVLTCADAAGAEWLAFENAMRVLAVFRLEVEA
eukprot:TRINITY_DN45684_c0_g1_i1.p1 TRINITY_DN45684_c0_g1~~TRINITY_DN45684_c0_g1_i1.p1  ORF type:complete len:235 (+),score=39.23 TRINITY_DN45684_c0_g1_i1:196-900(+)